ncbi:OLC1v1030840C1 [Oldenlandia corymbosa var. corymbosa]|uniref:OLC1v1030840C1 n=1 Tax=Oldenlandia corymbosa var. corymbosa TaxID=529605 RepID=A0AAV1CGY3_OLDCO|nr:OLC1v1030840C1 [Oldenlandia corymbosa var. corymbosa]
MGSTPLKLPCIARVSKFNCVGFLRSAAMEDIRGPRSLSFKIRAVTDSGNVQDANQVELGIMCEPCGGRGWLLCDFCQGQKTNVKAENKRIYRRCPSCRAIGYILCSKCKVFKCVTFPDPDDGVDLML